MERYRFHDEGSVFFVTFTVVQWLPVFISDAACKFVTDSFRFCHDVKGLRINAYVIMPTHLHAILFHESFDAGVLERAVTDFRKFTGRKLMDWSPQHLPSCFTKTFRQAAGRDRKRRFWQAARHPVLVENEGFWKTKFDYVHENPCRKGLVLRAQDWRFSSAAFWLSEGKQACDVPLTSLTW